MIIFQKFHPISAQGVAEEDSTAKNLSSNDRSVPWPLDLNVDGWPILPTGPSYTLPQLKDIARSLLTLAYRVYFSSLISHL